jgi:hypothetical protein
MEMRSPSRVSSDFLTANLVIFLQVWPGFIMLDSQIQNHPALTGFIRLPERSGVHGSVIQCDRLRP